MWCGAETRDFICLEAGFDVMRIFFDCRAAAHVRVSMLAAGEAVTISREAKSFPEM
jgi:hypothetical protein